MPGLTDRAPMSPRFRCVCSTWGAKLRFHVEELEILPNGEGSEVRWRGIVNFLFRKPEASRLLTTEGGGGSKEERKNVESCKWKGPEQMSWPTDRTRFQGDESKSKRWRGNPRVESATIA